MEIITDILDVIAVRYSPVYDGTLKNHIILGSNLTLKRTEKYLDMLEEAGYIIKKYGQNGDKKLIIYNSTTLGKKRRRDFKKVSGELDFDKLG